MSDLRQTPLPGTRLIRHQGDLLHVVLQLAEPRAGEAGLRTNLHRNRERLDEIIRHAERDDPILATDWHDLPMRQTAPDRFELSTPLLEVGRFEGKAFFLPRGSLEPEWPEGSNLVIKVEPARFASGNTLYTAFVRQFGPWIEEAPPPGSEEEPCRILESRGYTVIPPSGTFRDLIRRLDVIMDRMGFRILQLLPIHPIPTTYARMGRFGSPYAVLDFTAVDPSLADFDRRTTPLDQFHELLDAVHRRGGYLLMDIPANHTGWASWLQMHRPEWFLRGEDRSFQSPSAWGVTWSDLSQLDYRHRPLWSFMADVFLEWCRQGVDGFRCDAGYKIPVEAWQYIVAKVRRDYPETLFFLEGLGGDPAVVSDLLDRANLDWAYSEFFQWHDRHTIEWHLPRCLEASSTFGRHVHFAETHDNDRLAARSPEFARLRTALAALCSDAGAFGITNGVEWFARDKVDVHGAAPLRWGAPDNQVEAIARLLALLYRHPSFRPGGTLRWIGAGHGNVLVAARADASGRHPLLICANLDLRHPGIASWSETDAALTEGALTDLLTGADIRPVPRGSLRSCPLGPAEVRCLAPAAEAGRWIVPLAEALQDWQADQTRRLARVRALELCQAWTGRVHVLEAEAEAMTADLLKEPRAFCARLLSGDAPRESEPTPRLAPVVRWEWPRDTRRVVMVPPTFALLVMAPHAFRAEARVDHGVISRARGVRDPQGRYVAVLGPFAPDPELRLCDLVLTLHEPDRTVRASSRLWLLPPADRVMVPTRLSRRDVREHDPCALLTNGLGGYLLARGAWGAIRSQYDALLVANLHPRAPGQRRLLFTRCRGWIVHRAYSRELNLQCLESFLAGDQEVEWDFRVPAGMGRSIRLTARASLLPGTNSVSIVFERGPAEHDEHLPDPEPVRLILRPDIEDRDPHAKTKAYQGPERTWPRAVTPRDNGFRFAPSPSCVLDMAVQGGHFTWQPEWTYMVPHPRDRERGLDDASDLFSPGFFTCLLRGSETCSLTAEAHAPESAPLPALSTASETPARPRSSDRRPAGPAAVPFPVAVRRALRAFLARRGDGWTVLAGFPWFLDWGRDSLLVARGLIAAGWLSEACAILTEFAKLEKDGTLPNMLVGDETSNRETSDAPLWFLVACGDLLAADPSLELAGRPAGPRTVGDVMRSIGAAYLRGCPNGVRADPASGLIFSPAHYTWMDTNYPAGTPREGYPIEIQALWFRSLHVLAKLDPSGPWEPAARRVASSVERLFRRSDGLGLADCLHARPGLGAENASPDDALRPNQLLAVTMGLVRDGRVCSGVLDACEELLVPGALRSLADRPLRHPLRIEHHGRLLADPLAPYQGRYEGDEDTRRKPAYHNGTAWTWLLPSWCEAMVLTYGLAAREPARALLASASALMTRGCVGQLPEITDGDAPHAFRGCAAQAWSLSETYRVLAFLEGLR